MYRVINVSDEAIVCHGIVLQPHTHYTTDNPDMLRWPVIRSNIAHGKLRIVRPPFGRGRRPSRELKRWHADHQRVGSVTKNR